MAWFRKKKQPLPVAHVRPVMSSPTWTPQPSVASMLAPTELPVAEPVAEPVVEPVVDVTVEPEPEPELAVEPEPEPEPELETEIDVVVVTVSAPLPELALAPKLERALIALAIHTQQIAERLDRLESKVESISTADPAYATKAELLAVRRHSAQIAAELTLMSVELRNEIHRSQPAVGSANSNS